MSHPLCINDFKQNNSFDFVEKFFAEIFFSLFVESKCSVNKSVENIFLCDLVKLLSSIVKVIFNSDKSHKSVLKSFKIPVILNITHDIHIYRIAYEVLYHIYNVFVQIFSVENLLSLLVDDLTLSIHNVVVVKDILSDIEVSALDLLL